MTENLPYKPAVLCLNNWSGRTEIPVLILEEAGKRYRVRLGEKAALPRRGWVSEGASVWVPKSAVRPGALLSQIVKADGAESEPDFAATTETGALLTAGEAFEVLAGVVSELRDADPLNIDLGRVADLITWTAADLRAEGAALEIQISKLQMEIAGLRAGLDS